MDPQTAICQHHVANIVQTYANLSKEFHSVEQHVIIHLAKSRILSFEHYRAVVEGLPEVKHKLDSMIEKEHQIQPNDDKKEKTPQFYPVNTFDIMRNYLNDEEMHKVLDHLLEKLGFRSISSLILTANDVSTIKFLPQPVIKNWHQLETLILSRNKIHNCELSDFLGVLPNLKLLDLSQNFIVTFQSKDTSSLKKENMHEQLL